MLDGSPIEWFVEEIKGIDYAMFTTPVAAAYITASYVALQSADFNRDVRVDELDLARWRESFGVDEIADANGDGVTDGADFLVWQRQFKVATPASTAVPEPTPLLLLTAATACVLPRRPRGKTG